MEIQDVRSLTESGVMADASTLLTEATSEEATVATLPVVNLSIPFLSGAAGIMIGTTADGSGTFVVDASQLSLLGSSGVFADGVLQLSLQVCSNASICLTFAQKGPFIVSQMMCSFIVGHSENNSGVCVLCRVN